MDTFFIQIGRNSVKVNQFGKGPEVLICFHGFDLSGSSFKILEAWIGNYFTILAPDLPFHGDTEWIEGVLTPELLDAMAEQMMERTDRKVCHVLGFSMGGRLALSLAQHRKIPIKSLLLLAPEGLRENRWFYFSTRNLIGRALFDAFTRNPASVIPILKMIRRFKLVSKSQIKYVDQYISDEKIRWKIYKTWSCFRELRPRGADRLFKELSYPVDLWFGRYDRLIPVPDEKESGLWKPGRIHLISAGHMLLFEEATLKDLRTVLLGPGYSVLP